MATVQPDARSSSRREKDEQIAAEAPLPPPAIPSDAVAEPMEAHRRRGQRRPLALSGVVENGVVRLTDPGATLPENSRVIVVAEST